MPSTAQQAQLAQVGQLVGVGAGMTASVAALAHAGSAALLGTTAASVPVIGGIVAGVALIAALIFKGADPRQVPASKIEQVFQGAADKLYRAVQAGMITVDQAVAGMEMFIDMGKEIYSQNPSLGAATNSPGGKGIANMVKVIEAEEAAARQLHGTAIKAEIDPNAVKNFYPTQGTSGWYSESLAAADQVAGDYLAGLPRNFATPVKAVQAAGTVAAEASVTDGSIQVLGQTVQSNTVIGIVIVIMALILAKKVVFP